MNAILPLVYKDGWSKTPAGKWTKRMLCVFFNLIKNVILIFLLDRTEKFWLFI